MKTTTAKPVFRSQWGRGAVAVSPNGPVDQQLVRVQLPHAQDVAIAFQGMRGAAEALPATYRLTVGAGGIALFDDYLRVAAVGSVQHFIADNITVIGSMPQIGVAGTTRRIAACAALGVTRQSRQVGAFVSSIAVPGTVPSNLGNTAPSQWGWRNVATGNNALFRVPLWADTLAIQTKGIVGTLPAEMVVREVTFDGGVLVGTRLVSDFATPQALDPSTWFIEVDCTAAAGQFYALLNFTTRT